MSQSESVADVQIQKKKDTAVEPEVDATACHNREHKQQEMHNQMWSRASVADLPAAERT